MKIVGINGSPRNNGNSEWALSFLNGKCSQFAEMSCYHLSKTSINQCNGCLICEDNKPCPFNDDMDKIAKSLIESDIILFVTPVYFDNVTSVLKNFIDRTNTLGNQLSGKKAVVVTFGQADDVSWRAVISYLKNYFDIMGVEMILSCSYYARRIGDAKNDKRIVDSLTELSNKIKDI